MSNGFVRDDSSGALIVKGVDTYAGGIPAFQPVGLISPAPLSSVSVGTGTAPTAGTMYLARCLVPFDGTLNSFFVNTSVASNHVQGAIYRVSGTNLVADWTGTSVSAIAGWTDLGDPGLSVVDGEEIFLAVLFENAATLRRGWASNAAYEQYPTEWLSTVAGHISPAVTGLTYASGPPSSTAISGLVGSSFLTAVGALVTPTA